jgi:hypothetical protein
LSRKTLRPQPLVAGTAFLAAALPVWLAVSTASAETTYDLSCAPGTGRVQAVQVVLEVTGQLKLNADGNEVRELPLQVHGRLAYEERWLKTPAGQADWAAQAVRYYTQAEADLKIGPGTLTPRMDSQRRVVVASVGSDGSTFHSPLGIMNRDDLDLINVQGNTLLLSCLLPAAPVQIGQTWAAEQLPLGILFGLDVVTQCDVACVLEKVDGQTAILDIRGTIHGAVGGVASEIALKAKCNFDLDEHQITWLAANLKEVRAIGHAEPGLDVTARLRVATTGLEEPAHLTDDTLQQFDLEPINDLAPLVFQSRQAHFRLLHDPRWRAMVDRHDLSVFRFVDRGDLIAQCNISELPDVEAGKHMALEEFQAEVQQALGDKFGQVVDASQWTTSDGMRVLRVQAAGAVSEISVIWMHYHLSDAQGRRAALAFSMESKLLERFAEQDRTIVDTFEFTPRPEPTEASRPTPAGTTRS